MSSKANHGNTFLIIKQFNGDDFENSIFTPTYEARHKSGYTPLNWACYWAAKAIAFSDCTDEEVMFICADGHELRFVGWQPDMLMEFKDVATGEIVWSNCCSDWEH